jgi:hypothetical protein
MIEVDLGETVGLLRAMCSLNAALKMEDGRDVRPPSSEALKRP